jgi:hypothetical protein
MRALKASGGLDLAADGILELTRLSGLTLSELEKRAAATPSFSGASWDVVTSICKLDPSDGPSQLPTFSFPVVSLPPSFHREVMKTSAKWLDVYRERSSQEREAARVRLMDAVCTSLIIARRLIVFLSGTFPSAHCSKAA